MLRVGGARLRVICACGRQSSFWRNVAAVARRWQRCVRFKRTEIWTSDLPLQRRTRYHATNWPVNFLFHFLFFLNFLFYANSKINYFQERKTAVKTKQTQKQIKNSLPVWTQAILSITLVSSEKPKLILFLICCVSNHTIATTKTYHTGSDA